MHRGQAWAVAVVLVFGAGVVGCGRGAPQATQGTPGPGARRGGRAPQGRAAGGAAQATTAPLPEWAPENPSPEFLRAAKVLKPTPPEMLGVGSGDPVKEASAKREMRIMPAVWEFFGSLSDQHIREFQAGKDIRLPVQSLSAKQRAALDHWFEVHREVHRGQYPPEFKDQEDLLAMIHKYGAEQDLSNVDVGFSTPDGQAVDAVFEVQKADGKKAMLAVGSVAMM